MKHYLTHLENNLYKSIATGAFEDVDFDSTVNFSKYITFDNLKRAWLSTVALVSIYGMYGVVDMNYRLDDFMHKYQALQVAQRVAFNGDTPANPPTVDSVTILAQN